MRVLVLGSNGFIGQSLSNILENKFTVTNVSRETSLDSLLGSNEIFDFVINCVSSKPEANLLDSKVSNFDYPKKILTGTKFKHWIQLESYFQLQISMGRRDPYSIEKQRFSQFLDLNFSIPISNNINHLYLPHVFGANERNGRLIQSVISALKNGNVLKTSCGEQFLPLLHISDAVNGIVKFIENPSKVAACQPFWYGRLKDLLAIISSEFKHLSVEVGSRPDPIDNSFPRVQFPSNVVDWIPRMHMIQFLEWVRTQSE